MLKKPDARDLLPNSELGNVHEWGAGTYDGSNRKIEGMEWVGYFNYTGIRFNEDRAPLNIDNRYRTA